MLMSTDAARYCKFVRAFATCLFYFIAAFIYFILYYFTRADGLTVTCNEDTSDFRKFCINL